MAGHIKTAFLQINVLETLSCSSCQKIPLQEGIMQCSNGHIICELCYPSQDACRICQVEFRKWDKTPIKCVGVVVEVMNTIPLSCPFREVGCKEPDMTRSLMRQHLGRCEFRKLDNVTKWDTATTTLKETIPNSSGEEPAPSTSSCDNASQTPSTPSEDGTCLKCGACKKTLPNVPVYMNHYFRVHKKMRNNVLCPICGHRFYDTSNVFRHIGSCHNKGKGGSTGKPGFFCTFCQDPFEDRLELIRHLRQSHREDVVG